MADDFPLNLSLKNYLQTLFPSPSPPPSPPPQKHYIPPILETSEDLLHLSADSDSEHDPTSIPQLIRDKIRRAFDFNDFGGLIQFWAPIKTTGSSILLLTTSDQPFSLSGPDEYFRYRLCCEKYQYNIDHKVEDEEDLSIISTGAPATAFLKQIPELVRDHQMTPLESCAFECGLMYSFVLPVFYPSQSCCVGVVEYSSSIPNHLQVFNLLNMQLKKQGLTVYDVYRHLPLEIIWGPKNAKDEIDEALKIISQAHSFPLAQVWIPYKNLLNFSSSLQDTPTKQTLWLKLTGYIGYALLDTLDFRSLEVYSIASYGLPMKMDEMFAAKIPENYEPYFIHNISKLSDNKPRRLLSICFDCSCFVIYLRNTNTGDSDYVFEFLWSPKRGNHVKLFESLLLRLKRCLPSFKIASGSEVGDGLHILDVEDSTESEIKYFKIFQTKGKCKTTPIILSREQIESQFGLTLGEATKKLNVSLSTLKRKCKALGIHEWQGKDYLKRSAKYSYKSQRDMDEEEDNGGAIQNPSVNKGKTCLDENTVTVKAEFGDDMIKFQLPISSATFVAIEKEISEGFKLNPSDYKLKYLDEDGDWILITGDRDVRVCLNNQRNLNVTTIKMKVLPPANIRSI